MISNHLSINSPFVSRVCVCSLTKWRQSELGLYAIERHFYITKLKTILVSKLQAYFYPHVKYIIKKIIKSRCPYGICFNSFQSIPIFIHVILSPPSSTVPIMSICLTLSLCLFLYLCLIHSLLTHIKELILIHS